MIDYSNLIKSEAEKLRQLHIAVHEACLRKDKDRKSWEKACEKFHSYTSQIDPLINIVYAETEYTNQELLDFIINFLEIDPMFFRSGYMKEEMLRKVKRSQLTEHQATRLRHVLHQAVNHRGTREFKAYCRLATKIADKILISTLKTLAQNGEGALRSRARLMLHYVN